jgi:hypothetical protein
MQSAQGEQSGEMSFGGGAGWGGRRQQRAGGGGSGGGTRRWNERMNEEWRSGQTSTS